MKQLRLKINAKNDYELQLCFQEAFRQLRSGRQRFDEHKHDSSTVLKVLDLTLDRQGKLQISEMSVE